MDFCSKTVQWPDNFGLQSIGDSDQSMLCLQLMLIDIFANDTSSDWQADAERVDGPLQRPMLSVTK